MIAFFSILNQFSFQIKNDAVLLGVLFVILAAIFYTSSLPSWQKIYKYVPALLLCYFIPALLQWPLGMANPEQSQLYFVASRYLLPASLVLLCLSIDIPALIRLGPKALIMFFAATFGIVIGGPIALLVFKFSSSLFSLNQGLTSDELWRGMSTIAGSWIGGGANQTAMKEIYEVEETVFGIMLVVDIIVANVLLGFLLYGAGISNKMDKWLKADSSSIEDLKQKMISFQQSITKTPTTTQYMILLAVAFASVAIAHAIADILGPVMNNHKTFLSSIGLQSLASKFFWIIVISTTVGVLLSFTKAKQLEGVGASKIGSLFIYILVATIGLKMNLKEIFLKENLPLFIIGFTWIFVHVIILLLVARATKAPFFFVAVGSQANVGGAASAPIVASAFHPALASVGAIMAVIGYAVGTYGAIACAQLMQAISG